MFYSLQHRHAPRRAIILVIAGLSGLAGLILEYGLGAPSVATRLLTGVAVAGFFVELALAWHWRPGTREFLRSRWPSLLLTLLLLVEMTVVLIVAPKLQLPDDATRPWWRPTSLTRIFLVIAQIYVAGVLLVNVPRLHRRLTDVRIRPGLTFVLLFALAIFAGAGLLLLPRATSPGVDLGVLDALFTSTSAVCVTGLVVRDTATEFTRFGQVIILFLIQIGGLGIMSLSAVLALLLGRGISVRENSFMREVFQVPLLDAVGGVLRFIVTWTLVSESLGAFILYRQLRELVPDAEERAFVAVFHAVSAFCNAGFSTFSDSLIGWSPSGIALWTVVALLVMGGLGFTVARDLLRRSRAVVRGELRSRQPRLGLQTRVVVAWTGGLLLVGAVGVCALEWHGALGSLPWPERLAQAIFLSATSRTAGFNSVDLAALGPATLFLVVLLMFIGAGSGSTAGGVKITTLAVIAAEARAIAAGRRQIRLRERELDQVAVHRATVVLTTSALAAAAGIFLLLILEPLPPLALVFEAVSALGTVGLSLGVTPQLSTTGRIVVIMLMFVGRLGVLTFACALAQPARDAAIRLPRGRLMIG